MVSSDTLGSFWGGQGGFVEQVSTPDLLPVTTTLGAYAIVLSWTAIPGALRYVVYCGLAPDALSLQLDDLQATNFTVQNLVSGQRYFMQVLAVLSSGRAVASAVVSATASNVGVGTVYYGFTPTSTPNAAAVQALASRVQVGFSGSYTLTQSGAAPGYQCFAFPASAGIPSAFSWNGFYIGLLRSSVSIGGVAYNVFTNQFATSSTSQAWTVS